MRQISDRYREAWEHLEKALDAFLDVAEHEETHFPDCPPYSVLPTSETDREIWIACPAKKDEAKPSCLRKVGLIDGAGDDVCEDTVASEFPNCVE